MTQLTSIKMSIEMELLKRDYYLDEQNNLEVEIDQCIIINEKFLKYVARTSELSLDSDSSVEEQHEWYPCVNSYYPYTEDVDALERVNHLLGSDYSPSSNESSTTELFVKKKFPISEREFQNQYLLTTPLSFIIVGKPEIGQKDLGKMLADYWRSVYIEPETLIGEEIMNGSKAGQCIEFNLRHGRAIGIDVILKLVGKRIKSESAIHRGVVVCGLPVVANDLYVEDPVSTMSALFNSKEIFSETLETALQKAKTPGSEGSPAISSIRTEDDESERETDEYTETETVFPDYSTIKSTLFRHISDLPADIGGDEDINFSAEMGMNYEEQLKYLFDLIEEPFLIIYMMCCTQDVIEKRNSCRFSVYSKCETQVTKSKTHDKEEFSLSDVLNYVDKRYLVRVPRNFPANICTQLDNYHTTAVKFLERKILLHDPQYFLKVDARNEIEVIFETVRMKLIALPHYRVACPDLLSRFDIKIDSGEDKSELDMIGKIDYDLFFKLYRTQDAPGPFQWTWSDWKKMCPVSMKEGHCKRGDVDYAMHFMNRIFFLADEEALIKFSRNPRRYLLPPFPKSLCKIYIFGPHASGKSTVAKCLACYMDGTIMYPTDMFKQILEEKEDQVRDRIRQAAVNEAMSILMQKHREEAAALEEERLQKIKEWVTFTISEIQRMILLLEEHQREEVVTKFEISSFPMAMEKTSMADLETETTLAIRQIRDYLEQEKIPFSKDTKFLENLISDKRRIIQYLPGNLRRKIKPLPVSPDDPFVQDFAAEAVANAAVSDLDVSSENILDMLINAMKECESEYARKGHNKGGWILDDMLCDTSLLEQLYPEYMADEIILLKDTSPNFEYSVNRYTNWTLESFKEFQRVFLNLNKTDVSCPSQSVSSGESSKVRFVQNVVSEILDNDFIYLKDELNSKRPENYRRRLEHFYEKWESIKEFFNKKNRDVMEIDIANKSFPELLEEIIRKIDRKYSFGAQRYTEEDRIEEVTDLTKEPIEITEGTVMSPEVSEENRMFGNTFHFCPVTYHEKWVLWKGKEDFAAKFENKVYLLSSDEDLQRFLYAPDDFFPRDSCRSLPPPRICVIGDPVSRKTKISQAISSNYGLSYVSFLELVKKEYNIPSYESFFEMSQNSKIYSFIFNYLHVGEPLPETLYAKQLSNLWFTPPIKDFGFVLDDFPKRDCDVAMMVKYKLIPDIVILLSGNKNVLKEKLKETVLQNWELRKAKGYSEINHVAILELGEKRQKRFQELLDERRERRFAQKQKGKESKTKSDPESAETDSELNQSGTGTTSQISFNSVEEQKDIDDINKILDVELPEVVSEQTEETFEEAKGRLESQVSETFEHETQCIKSLKNEFKAHNIPFENVIVETDFHERTVRNVFYIIDPIKDRNQSFFEKCYDVDIELAEKLLSAGYYFLSKFGRLCPVHYHKNNNPFYLYELALKNNSLLAVIHRSFIYFIYGKENLEKFKNDPLLYVNIGNVEFPSIPFILAITGPPKCGKTALADRLRKEFGLKVVTRGQAIRDVLSQLPYCSLAIQMENILRKGWELPDELVIKCIEAACCDSDATVQARRVPVPDERFDYLCEFFKPASKVPAFLNIVDIAGLVKGASEGQGLGNAFLSHISACDAIFHLCRAFESEDVTHVEGDVNPVRDLDIISEELRLKDEDTLLKNLDKLEKTVLRGDKRQKAEYDTLVKVKEVLVDEKKHIRFADWDIKDVEVLNKYLFLTSKPALYLVNLSEKDYIKKKNKWLIKIKEWVDKNDPGALIIPFSGVFEHKLVEEYSDPVERKKFLEDNGTTSALEKIIVQGYKALQLEYFFTAGPDEVKAWTIQKGTKAPQAAGRIHTDFEKGFIMAEVMKFTDFKEEGSEAACKAAGKYRQQGRNYVVDDGDIIFFKFNAGAGLQAKKK